MLFKKDKKIAFVLVPKCGSTSISRFLFSIGFARLTHSTLPNHHHIKYRDALSAYPNLSKYTTHGIFRDPLARFVSGINSVKNSTLPVEYDNYTDINFLRNLNPVIFERQVDWLDHEHISVLPFSNLEQEVLSTVSGLDGEKKLLWLNKTTTPELPISDAVKKFVRDHYAIDYQFAKDVLGKEY